MGIEIGVLAGWLGTAVILGAAATGGAMALSSSAQQATKEENAARDAALGAKGLATPSPDTSLADAQQAADRRRQTIMASGGATNPTGAQGALLNPTQVSGKTLLGS